LKEVSKYLSLMSESATLISPFTANELEPIFFFIQRLAQDVSPLFRKKRVNLLRQVGSTQLKLIIYIIIDLADPFLSLKTQIGVLDRIALFPHRKPNLYQLLRHSRSPEGGGPAAEKGQQVGLLQRDPLRRETTLEKSLTSNASL